MNGIRRSTHAYGLVPTPSHSHVKFAGSEVGCLMKGALRRPVKEGKQGDA